MANVTASKVRTQSKPPDVSDLYTTLTGANDALTITIFAKLILLTHEDRQLVKNDSDTFFSGETTIQALNR